MSIKQHPFPVVLNHLIILEIHKDAFRGKTEIALTNLLHWSNHLRRLTRAAPEQTLIITKIAVMQQPWATFHYGRGKFLTATALICTQQHVMVKEAASKGPIAGWLFDLGYALCKMTWCLTEEVSGVLWWRMVPFHVLFLMQAVVWDRGSWDVDGVLSDWRARFSPRVTTGAMTRTWWPSSVLQTTAIAVETRRPSWNWMTPWNTLCKC